MSVSGLRIALAQINTTVGDLAGNLRKIIAYSERAREEGADLIVDMDGQPIGDFSDLNSYLVFHAQVGQTIEITVLRDGERVVVPLTLGARP